MHAIATDVGPEYAAVTFGAGEQFTQIGSIRRGRPLRPREPSADWPHQRVDDRRGTPISGVAWPASRFFSIYPHSRTGQV